MMMAQAKEVIERNGIEVEEVEALKGSCRVQGLTVGSGRVKPTLYQKMLEDVEDEDELLRMVNMAMEKKLDVDIELILQKDYIIEHCISCIRHQTDDDRAVKWPVFGDLEEIVRIRLGDNSNGVSMTVTVHQGILDNAGMTADELRMYARRNLKEEVSIKSMTEIMCEMMGAEQASEMGLTGFDDVMYVATNKSRIGGAAVMLLDDVLDEFCKTHGLEKIYIIPSSLHEVILVSPMMGEDEVNSMIVDVNRTQVDEWDRLSDHVYHFIAA